MENKEEKKVITITEVISCLDKNMNRAEIAAHFGLNKKECAALFQNPKLKGLKPRKKNIVSFTLVDDTEEKTEETKTEKVKAETATDEKSTEADKIPNLYADIPSDEVPETPTAELPTETEKKPWGTVTVD